MFNPQLAFLLAIFCHSVFAQDGSDEWVHDGVDGWIPLRNAQKLRQLRKSTRVSKTPCSCNEGTATCICCATFAGEKGCASFKIPEGKNRNQLVRYNFNFNDQSTTTMTPAGVDPPPLCLEILGGWIAEACAVFEVTATNGQYYQACVTLKVTLATLASFEAELDCANLYLGSRPYYHDEEYVEDESYGPVLLGSENRNAKTRSESRNLKTRSENRHAEKKKSSSC